MENRVILTKVRAKKYISLMKKWHLQYMSLDDLSLQSGITVEHIIEEFSSLDPMIRMLCDDYNVLDLLKELEEFAKPAPVSTKKKVVKKAPVLKYVDIYEFIYQEMTLPGGLIDKNSRLSLNQLKELRKLINAEIKNLK